MAAYGRSNRLPTPTEKMITICQQDSAPWEKGPDTQKVLSEITKFVKTQHPNTDQLLKVLPHAEKHDLPKVFDYLWSWCDMTKASDEVISDLCHNAKNFGGFKRQVLETLIPYLQDPYQFATNCLIPLRVDILIQLFPKLTHAEKDNILARFPEKIDEFDLSQTVDLIDSLEISLLKYHIDKLIGISLKHQSFRIFLKIDCTKEELQTYVGTNKKYLDQLLDFTLTAYKNNHPSKARLTDGLRHSPHLNGLKLCLQIHAEKYEGLMRIINHEGFSADYANRNKNILEILKLCQRELHGKAPSEFSERVNELILNW